MHDDNVGSRFVCATGYIGIHPQGMLRLRHIRVTVIPPKATGILGTLLD